MPKPKFGVFDEVEPSNRALIDVENTFIKALHIAWEEFIEGTDRVTIRKVKKVKPGGDYDYKIISPCEIVMDATNWSWDD